MGCDIHWILERRHQDGRWEATYSKSRFYSKHFDWKTPYGEGLWKSPAMALATRDYDVFAVLSGVRGEPGPDGPLATDWLPEDASEHTLQAFGDDGDLHSHGWLPGSLLAGLAKTRGRSPARAFAKSAVALLRMPQAGEAILPPYIIDDENGWTFADLAGAESHHQMLERHKRAEHLLPASDPEAWRLIIAYDN